MATDPKDKSKDGLDLHQFMRAGIPTERGQSQLGDLAEKYGGDACLKAACEALHAGYAVAMIRAGANPHQSIKYQTAQGEQKTGSLMDLALAATRSNRQDPEMLLGLLKEHGVKAAGEWDRDAFVRYNALPAPQPSFTQAASRFDVAGMFRSAARFAARNVEALAPPVSARARKLDTI